MQEHLTERHFNLVRTLVERGAYFFDYGNAFLRAVFDAGVTEGIEESE